MAFEGERALLFDRIRELESKLDREMEAHATLQQRCFDYGNPTHSSIFDERDMLKSKLGELSEAFTRMEEDRDVWRKHSDELREAGRIAVAEIQSRLGALTKERDQLKVDVGMHVENTDRMHDRAIEYMRERDAALLRLDRIRELLQNCTEADEAWTASGVILTMLESK